MIEWVDAADPDEPSAQPNFGWSLKAVDGLPDNRRLALLLTEVATAIEAEQGDG